jgi:hypothetical protein
MSTDEMPIYPYLTFIIDRTEADEESVSLGLFICAADISDRPLVPHYLVGFVEVYARGWGLEGVRHLDLAFGAGVV